MENVAPDRPVAAGSLLTRLGVACKLVGVAVALVGVGLAGAAFGAHSPLNGTLVGAALGTVASGAIIFGAADAANAPVTRGARIRCAVQAIPFSLAQAYAAYRFLPDRGLSAHEMIPFLLPLSAATGFLIGASLPSHQRRAQQQVSA